MEHELVIERERDASLVAPATPGVNPSFTITAMAERAMARIE